MYFMNRFPSWLIRNFFVQMSEELGARRAPLHEYPPLNVLIIYLCIQSILFQYVIARDRKSLYVSYLHKTLLTMSYLRSVVETNKPKLVIIILNLL